VANFVLHFYLISLSTSWRPSGTCSSKLGFVCCACY